MFGEDTCSARTYADTSHRYTYISNSYISTSVHIFATFSRRFLYFRQTINSVVNVLQHIHNFVDLNFYFHMCRMRACMNLNFFDKV